MVNANESIDDTQPLLDKVKDVVARCSGGKADGLFTITGKLLSARTEAIINGLYAFLAIVWQPGINPLD